MTEYVEKPQEPQKPLWYAIHTYSGYENSVKNSLEKSIEVNTHLQDKIFEVFIPTEQVVEIRNGKRRVIEHKIFPGYVMVKMIMTNEAWYMVRNTRGVTGFVGSEGNASPMSDEEIEKMLNRTTVSVDIEKGQNVRILSGSFVNQEGKVINISDDCQKVTVLVSGFMGKDVEVEVDYNQVLRVEA